MSTKSVSKVCQNHFFAKVCQQKKLAKVCKTLFFAKVCQSDCLDKKRENISDNRKYLGKSTVQFKKLEREQPQLLQGHRRVAEQSRAEERREEERQGQLVQPR